jgi:hypothetical protein
VLSAIVLPITTDASGAAVVESHNNAPGYVAGIYIDLGTLETPDVTLDILSEDGQAAQTFYNVAGVAADTYAYPAVLAVTSTGLATTGVVRRVIHGNIRATIAGGGNAKSGQVKVYVER